MPTEVPMLEPHIRGISLHDITGRRHLFLNSEASEESYSLSRPVEKLDIFLSHSWSGSPFWKHMTLVTNLYVKFGYIAMLVTVIPLSVATYFLPAGKREAVAATQVLGGFAMFFGMWFGYLVPNRTNKRMVFLDKCCIPQVDLAAMKEGLTNMEAYLNRSDKLLILWTPEYFSRLWCVFELASYLRSHGPNSIACLSARFGRFYHVVVWFEIAFIIIAESVNAAIPSNTQIQRWVPYACWSVTEAALSVGVGLIVLFYCVPAKMELNKQIQHFSMTSAQCTFTEDTALLTCRISEWYGSQENFDNCIRDSWPRISTAMKTSDSALPIEIVAFVMFPYVMALCPRLACAIAWNNEFREYSWSVIIRSTLLLHVLLACRTPLFVVISYRMGNVLEYKSTLAKCFYITVVVLFALLYSVTQLIATQGVLFFYGPPAMVLFTNSSYPWFFVILPITAVALVYWTHCPRCVLSNHPAV
ncbi:hypothetical protein FOL47_008486 [Perkinsus chesapeaki]|uniref:Uncharacterized protein n=1 Tax=Perkinsus chesapeaki TaxID=330153 RepID=A0A7J6LDK5_PERCH|nr:hypothetical protein FOL47_008486 [Perkinsus chesapeaki]